jgi:hypothetical protein
MPPATSAAGPAPEMAALRAAEIAATVPWRLSPDDLEWARANGLLDKALAVPGVMA